MATADRTLMLKLIADVNQPAKQIKGLGSTLRKSAGAVKSWGKAFGGALVIGGIEKVVDSLGEAEAGFVAGEDAARAVSQTWKRLDLDAGKLGRTLDVVGDQANNLGFDDAEVLRGYNLFLQLTGDTDKSMRLVGRAMDVARGRGISFAKALKLVKGDLDETDKSLIRNKNQARIWARNHPLAVGLNKISDLWSDFVGNFKRGKINQAFAAIGKIGETIGTLLFGGVLDKKTGVRTEGIVAQFAKIGPRIIDAILGGLVELGSRLQTAWDEQIATVDWGKAIPDALGTFWNDTLNPFLTGLGEKGPIATAAVIGLAGALALLAAPAIAATLPFIALALAIAGITLAVKAVVDHLPDIQKALQDVQTAIQPLLDGISGAFDTVTGHIVNLMVGISNTVGFLIEQWNNLLGLIGLAKQEMGPGSRWGHFAPFSGQRGWGQGPTDWPELPTHFAEGAIVRRPVVGLVGESGPEAIIPLDEMARLGGITVNITTGVGDPVEIGRQVDRVLRAYRGRAGLAA